jgi:hypothetical protein
VGSCSCWYRWQRNGRSHREGICFFNISPSPALSLVFSVRWSRWFLAWFIITPKLGPTWVEYILLLRRWITFCGVAPCTGMNGFGLVLNSWLWIVLFVVRDMLALRQWCDIRVCVSFLSSINFHVWVKLSSSWSVCVYVYVYVCVYVCFMIFGPEVLLCCLFKKNCVLWFFSARQIFEMILNES